MLYVKDSPFLLHNDFAVSDKIFFYEALWNQTVNDNSLALIFIVLISGGNLRGLHFYAVLHALSPGGLKKAKYSSIFVMSSTSLGLKN